MSGIFGLVGAPDRDLLGRMAAVLVHRGADGAGALEAPAVSLGCRLVGGSDGAGGQQPLANEDESVWLAFDGDVFNSRELRRELEAAGHVFRTGSGAEVVVHAYEEWGPSCAARFNGMWAFAVADLREGDGRLVLNRDHLGIKPLYYSRSSRRGELRFASEIKALLQDEGLAATPDDQMVSEYLQVGLHDHRQQTFFSGVYRVPAAAWIDVSLEPAPQAGAGGGAVATPVLEPLPSSAYWVPELGRAGSGDPALFRRLLRDGVARRLVSEMPVGSSLTGELESTAVLALMGELTAEGGPDGDALRGRLRTIAAVSDGDCGEERAALESAAQSAGAEATYVSPTSPGFVDELRDFVWHQEEPVAGTGPYAEWCLLRAARERVTVVLDGRGGDELLAGHVSSLYAYLRQLRRQKRYADLRRESVAARHLLWPRARRELARRGRRLSPRRLLRPDFLGRTTRPVDGRSGLDLKERLLEDLVTYSLPRRLRYQDRNATAFGVECRLPYLDQALVEHVLSLPDEALIRDGQGGWVLRAAMKGTVAEATGPQGRDGGDAAPAMRWLKARRAAFTSLFQSPSFRSRPYWDGAALTESFRACCRGEVEESAFFWRAANVELWLREFVDRDVVLHDVDVDAALSAPAAVGPEHRGSVAEAGDALVPGLLEAAGPQGAAAADEARRLFAGYTPNEMKHLFAALDGVVWARLPLKTDLVGRGDDLGEVLRRQVVPHVRPGDVVVMAEKPIAASQGRSYALDEIHPTRLAKVLSRAVTRTPHGIGLGIPETMQLAIDEAGASRIVAAAAAGAMGKLVRRRGWFYRAAGANVEAIDGPTHNTLPPHNTHAKLGPADPDGVATGLAGLLSEAVSGRIDFVVIDANDLTAKVLGASPGTDRDLAASLMRDNPLGQGHEQTPVCVLRRLGPLSG